MKLLARHPQSMNVFIERNKLHINDIFRQKMLEHPESGKLSCYVISNGEMYKEQQEVADILFSASVLEVANDMGVDLKKLDLDA